MAISNDTKVTLGAACLFFVAFVGYAVAEARWQTNISRDVLEIRKDNGREFAVIRNELATLDSKLLGKSPDGWHKFDMREWAYELRLSNPSVSVPKVQNTLDRGVGPPDGGRGGAR